MVDKIYVKHMRLINNCVSTTEHVFFYLSPVIFYVNISNDHVWKSIIGGDSSRWEGIHPTSCMPKVFGSLAHIVTYHPNKFFTFISWTYLCTASLFSGTDLWSLWNCFRLFDGYLKCTASICVPGYRHSIALLGEHVLSIIPGITLMSRDHPPFLETSIK